MLFLVTIVTGSLAQVPIFPTRWPVAATITIVFSRDLSGIDSSSRGRALKLGAAGAVIARILIAPTLLVVPIRSLGLSGLGAMKRHGLWFVGAERKEGLVPGVILGRFRGRAMAPEIANIYLTDPQRKVHGGFSLSRNCLLDCLVLSIFLTTFLLGLGTDGRP